MTQNPYSKNDRERILEGIGPVVPLIFREAVDEGHHNHNVSRTRDPGGYAELSLSTRAAMRINRMTHALRGLIEVAGIPELRWRESENRCAIEIFYDPYIAFRVKRSKKKRGGRTTGYLTPRVRGMKSDVMVPSGQMGLEWPDGTSSGMSDEGRIWLSASFDMDELEEEVTSFGLGVETRKKVLWKEPILPADDDVIASLPMPLADHITDLRQRRSA